MHNYCFSNVPYRGSKKTEKSIKPKEPNHEKNQLNRLKFWKKQTGSVRFWFYKPGTEKTEPNPNKKNWKKTQPNRFGFGFFKKNIYQFGYFFI